MLCSLVMKACHTQPQFIGPLQKLAITLPPHTCRSTSTPLQEAGIRHQWCYVSDEKSTFTIRPHVLKVYTLYTPVEQSSACGHIVCYRVFIFYTLSTFKRKYNS